MECVYGGLRYQLEVGECEDPNIVYFKAKKPLKEICAIARGHLNNYGVDFDILDKREDPSGNIIKAYIFVFASM